MNPAMNAFTFDSSFPPSLAKIPILAMLTQVGFWAVTLLCLQWIYSIMDDSRAHPAPIGSYVRVSRIVKLRLLVIAFALVAPRLILVAAWQRMSPFEREAVALVSWVILIPCAIVMALGWWSDRAARPTERMKARSRQFIEIAPPTAHEKTRGIIGLILIFVIAFSTTFIRVDPRHVPARPVAIPSR